MKKHILVTIFFLLKSFTSFSQTPVDITSDTLGMNNQLSHSQYAILYDSSGTYKASDVIEGLYRNKFIINEKAEDSIGKEVEAIWLLYRFKNTLSFSTEIVMGGEANIEEYYIKHVNNKWEYKKTGGGLPARERTDYKFLNLISLKLEPGEEVTVYTKWIVFNLFGDYWTVHVPFESAKSFTTQYAHALDDGSYLIDLGTRFFYLGMLCLAIIINLLFFIKIQERLYLFYTLYLLTLFVSRSAFLVDNTLFQDSAFYLRNVEYIFQLFNALTFLFFTLFVRNFLRFAVRYPYADKIFLFISFGIVLMDLIDAGFHINERYVDWGILVFRILIFIYILKSWRQADKLSRLMIIAVLPVVFIRGIGASIAFFFSQLKVHFDLHTSETVNWIGKAATTSEFYALAWLVLLFSWALFQRFVLLRNSAALNALEKEKLEREKELERNALIAKQRIELKQQVEERTYELKQSLEELKSTQAQLIQSEKMASLGELTAGIAHEIQNPLNFVNNFSEVNNELVEEIKNENSIDEIKAIAEDIKQNSEKILFHGKRADAIVKGMLQHSRQTKGIKEPTDINALCDEYVRLSYHGLRAKDKSFNADFKTDFDENIGKINIVPQDIGRVLLNLFNNAFYATNERQKMEGEKYKPLVTIQTKKLHDKVEIRIADNGNGIPSNITDKIFQPFFTTKPTGQGTGLGLSLAYDIITKEHNGTIKVESKESVGSTFIIQLPV